VPVADLNPYYKNARRGDVEKVAESLHENGQFKPIVVNVGTKTGRENEILAGNHTYLAARRLGWETMLVSWVDLDEDQARQVVLADNAAGDHSTYDEALLTELLQEQQESTGSLLGTAFDNDVLGKLVKKMNEDENANVDMIEEASDYLGGVDDMADNIVFPSDLPYEMPPLLENMCLDELPVTPDKLDVWAGHELDLPRQEAEPDRWWLTQWHAGCRGVNWKQSIPYFYCPDAHFESLFLHPAQQTKKILNLGCKAVIMPNYSIDEVAPSATWVWAMYRNLYMARYFQEAGIKVIPDIRVGTTGSDVLELYAPSYPKGVGVVACQIQNANKDPEYIRATARVLREAEERIEFQSIIVYGHNDADDAVKRAGLSCEVIRVQNRSARRREYLNSGSTINTQKVSKSRKKS
jgi:ParB-like chromosome segregation protein Spo0J